ncbi:phosphatase PAP2 family protein [Flexivirga caeni]|uniref:Phosphatase PAP2 family protein n=1 Tax=Flexivirga caeni TaxID=2294115 RepID=A0A3M9MGY8_9MICO|nr:phosphatase PAP2 family protein [Flexivirga caeni]RNI24819.1 phosphatase PAP2 family protein [Flexivirga caeni]
MAPPSTRSEARQRRAAHRAAASWRQTVGAHPVMLLAGLAIGLLGLVVGAIVTGVGARDSGELSLDIWLSRHRDGLLVAVGKVVQVGFGPMVAPQILVVVCAALWWRRDRVAAVIVALLAIPGWFSVEAGKILFHRARPPAGTVHALVHETQPDSFPSGHVAFAAALVAALAVAFHHRRHVSTWIYRVGVPVVVVVAACRLIVGAHYLADVLASPLFATGTILVLVALGSHLPAALSKRLATTP